MKTDWFFKWMFGIYLGILAPLLFLVCLADLYPRYDQLAAALINFSHFVQILFILWLASGWLVGLITALIIESILRWKWRKFNSNPLLW